MQFEYNKFRYTFFLAFLLWLALPAAGVRPAEALEELLASKALDSTQTALYIWDLDADFLLTGHNSRQPVIPASVMKCVTTGALGTVMPYSLPITTRIYLDGRKSGDEFAGAIVVVGAADPSLSDGRHGGQPDFIAEMVDAVRRKGIRSISGEIIVDESIASGPPTPDSWLSEDLTESYGTGFHAFNFEGNASGKKAVKDPAAVFRKKLIAALQSAGISFASPQEDLLSVREGKSAKRELLLEYSSPPLRELMRSCMFRSDNLYAESFLRLFGLQNGSDGSAAMSAVMAMQHWDALGFPLDGVEIVDGSGLSRQNRLSAEFLGSVLRSRKNDPDYVSFFPLAGEEGTVRNFLKDTPLQGRMALKTGSMKGIQSYAGYLLDENFAPTHVVVVMTNGLKDRGAFRVALAKFFQSVFAPQLAPN